MKSGVIFRSCSVLFILSKNALYHAARPSSGASLSLTSRARAPVES